jgi:AcrR family transcriptional regulator
MDASNPVDELRSRIDMYDMTIAEIAKEMNVSASSLATQFSRKQMSTNRIMDIETAIDSIMETRFQRHKEIQSIRNKTRIFA